MNDLAPFISQLLYRNECVIIPGFGGIVAKYASAEVHPIQNIFLPPHKTLAFNKALKHDDGLLASDVVMHTGVTYEAAMIAISQYVRKLESDLQGKNQTTISGVGKLFYDIEHNLIFESTADKNYLSNAFGFDRFVVQPVWRHEEVIHQIENQIAEKRKVRSFNWAAAALVLVVAFVGWQVWSINFNSPNNSTSNADMGKSVSNLFSDEKKTVPVVAENPVSETETPSAVVMTENSATENNAVADLNEAAIGAEAISIAYSFQPEIAFTEIITSTDNSPKYYLIFACFQSHTRANNFIAQMKSKGQDMKILIEDSYLRIGNGIFQTIDEANAKAHEYHTQGYAEVWVLKK